MRKFIFQTIYTVLVGLSIFSCSELILPKQVWLKGTVNAPIKVGATKLNVLIAEEMNEVFASGKEEGTIVYNVDYEEQTVQTFCIYIPIEMTEDINPNNFLKTIDKQINSDMDGNATPKKIDPPYLKYPPGGHIPITDINLFDGDNNIPYIFLDDIAGYVYTIDFGICQEDVDSGIGLNFHFDKIPNGLEMTVKCFEIEKGTPHDIFSTTKPLHEGDNKFGNDKPLLLEVNDDQGGSKKLHFTIELQSEDHNSNEWDISGSGLNVGDDVMKGEMSVFHVWTKAEINLANALKASSTQDNKSGRYPAKDFDLSRLGKYFEGEFDFNSLEAKIYMDGHDPESINRLDARLEFRAYYEKDEKHEELYMDKLFINSEPMKLDDYLDKHENEFYYKYQHLPRNISPYEDEINDEAIANIFKAMPADLYFNYSIIVGQDSDGKDKRLTIYPESADDTGASGAIKTTIMIMLPMSLTAKGDAGNPSRLFLSDMFGNGDLFGRDEPKNLFGDADVEVDHIRMTVDFHDEIFTNGYLFINREKELFPQGIPLSNKGIAVDFTDEQLKEAKENLIVPSINIEFDREGTVNILKDMGILGVKFEMKGLINIGEM